MHIPTEAKVYRAVIAQDGTVDGHLASDWNVRIAMQHLVAEQVERKLRSRYIGADHIKRRDGQLTDNWSGHPLHRSREHPDQASGQADQLGGVHALEKFRSLMNRSQQLLRLSNIQRNGDGNQRNAVAQVRRVAVAAQINGDHDPQQLSLNTFTVQFTVASNGRSHESENDVINARS